MASIRETPVPEPKYLKAEAQAIEDAKERYREALAKLQADCEHPIILRHEDSYYKAHRVCEDCGYHESVQYDSHYRYKDQRLTKRYFAVSWREYYAALPKVRPKEE